MPISTDKTPWIPETIHLLRERWEVGVLASEIATELNNLFKHHRFTKNAVIGKAHRMDFKQPPKVYSPKPPRNRPRKRILMPRSYVPWAQPTLQDTEVATEVIVVRENNHGIGIMSLTQTTCRAIIGRGEDDLALYCGDHTYGAKSFCAGHCALYYQVPEARKR